MTLRYNEHGNLIPSNRTIVREIDDFTKRWLEDELPYNRRDWNADRFDDGDVEDVFYVTPYGGHYGYVVELADGYEEHLPSRFSNHCPEGKHVVSVYRWVV